MSEAEGKNVTPIEGATAQQHDDDKVSVEFRVHDLIRAVDPGRQQSLVSCAGCTGCTGCAH